MGCIGPLNMELVRLDRMMRSQNDKQQQHFDQSRLLNLRTRLDTITGADADADHCSLKSSALNVPDAAVMLKPVASLLSKCCRMPVFRLAMT